MTPRRPPLPRDTALKCLQPEYFGQYGGITKLVINHHQGVSSEDPRYGSASAYITFGRQEDAWAAICSVDGFHLMGRTIRASFGTTKYCNSFLRNLPCNNPECLYLHELGDEGDRFTKDEVQLGLARHGSSFAFKEEVLGNGDGSGRFSRHGSAGGGSDCEAGEEGGNRPSRPANPVLPPPCPMTSPRPAAAAIVAGNSNSTHRISSHDAGGGGGGALGTVSGGGSFGRLSAAMSPSGCQSWSEQQRPVVGRDGGGGCVGGSVRGSVGPGSPSQIESDGRPRPRRRRGQRGRRGGGGGGNGAGNGGGVGLGGGRGGAGGAGAGAEDSGERVGGMDTENFAGRACDSEEGCVVGSGRVCLVSSPVEWGEQVKGDDPPASCMAIALSRHTGHDGGPCSASGLVSYNVGAAGRRSHPSVNSYLGGLDGASNMGPVPLVGSYCRKDVGGGDAYGGSGELYHLDPKPATWGGSDRSTGSSRSAEASSCYGGGGGGGSYWGKPCSGGRGSPLATPETLTNTPPIEPSSSEPSASCPSTFPGLSGLNSTSLWNLGNLRATTSSVGEDDLERETTGAGMFSKRCLQARSPLMFFDHGEGRQGASRPHLGGGSGGAGGDLVSISEGRPQRQDRSRSLDLGIPRSEARHQQQSWHQQQQQRWEGDDGAELPLLMKQYTDELQTSGGGGGGGGGGSGVGVVVGGNASTPLFMRQSRSTTHLSQKSVGGAFGASDDAAYGVSAAGRSPSVPPGLTLPGAAAAEGDRLGCHYVDENYSEGWYEAPGRDQRSTSWDNGIDGGVDVSGNSMMAGRGGEGVDTWTQQSMFAGVDQFSMSASLDEVSFGSTVGSLSLSNKVVRRFSSY